MYYKYSKVKDDLSVIQLGYNINKVEVVLVKELNVEFLFQEFNFGVLSYELKYPLWCEETFTKLGRSASSDTMVAWHKAITQNCHINFSSKVLSLTDQKHCN